MVSGGQKMCPGFGSDGTWNASAKASNCANDAAESMRYSPNDTHRFVSLTSVSLPGPAGIGSAAISSAHPAPDCVAVPIGTHEIVFRHPDLGERRTTATVTTGAPTRVSMDMRAK